MITDIGNRYGAPTAFRVSGSLATRGVDLSQASGDSVRLNLVGNITGVKFLNGVAGMRLIVLLVQDATGSRTATWATNVHFAAETAPTLTTTALHGDLLHFWFDGTNFIEIARSLDVGVV